MQILKRAWQDLALGSKLVSMTSLLGILAILALTLVSIQRERTSFEDELEQQALLFLDTMSLSIRDPLYRLELDELLDISRVVVDNPAVTMFMVFDDDGKVLVDSNSPGASFSQTVDPYGGELVRMRSGEISMAWEEEQLVAGQPVILGNQVIGAAAVGLSTAPLAEKISNLTWQGILLAAITFIVGGGAAMWLTGQIISPLSELTRAVTRMSEGNLAVRVAPQGKDEIGRLAEAFNDMATGLQEREWLRDMFGRVVSKEVAEAIHSGQVRLEGENRVVSVLFCDIRDFTDYSSRHTPDEVVKLLNEFLPLVVQSAQEHGGMVNKFGGDSTLVIFGAPYEMQDSAYHAVVTALEIRSRLNQLNEKLGSLADEGLRVGVGINTGMALAGAVGPMERQEYTVVGNTVNLAARIDGLNKRYPEYDILISEWTYEALGDQRDLFEIDSLGEVRLRGKDKPVSIYAVKDRRWLF